MGELKHYSHEHKLILNAAEPIFDRNAGCVVCRQPVHEMIDIFYRCTTAHTRSSSCAGFFLHKTCAELPSTFTHPVKPQLCLSLIALPIRKHKFWECYVCQSNSQGSIFFAHVKCASSTEMLSGYEINYPADPGESHLMHFPAPDEASLNKMIHHCIIGMATSDSLQYNSAIVELSPYINHWSHKHQLALRNRNTNTLTHDLNRKLAQNELQICDGCTKPICLINDIMYECNSCNYILHSSCAQFPEKIQHHLAGNLGGLTVRSYNQWFKCKGCGISGNGICMHNDTVCFDIGCASLPEIIKHEAHHHHLIQLKYPNDFECKACGREGVEGKTESIIFGCEICEFYMHIQCMLKPHRMNHRWDPHPLHLILSPKDVAEHPHEFECEFCSEQINTNTWFYHCSVCDQSFHISCSDPYWLYSNMKFGATNIYLKSHPHSHGLTYVLNKKKRKCKICGLDTWGLPVLECSPCKFVVHSWCDSSVHLRNV
ncbi:Phorbol-ester/DAG-type domain-containing protein [Heracleum sosnowskyi]|uniref:Phorbol-ester/DAG-type domain-containing protein n=1 Tax=Heracleum sosnowskyi TaxID=360622 RepID=A0AAD8HHB1_9APIA|nr:Phorbol-ester/DAG-type domain-containing protein [Heracleum sosnowskyi]